MNTRTIPEIIAELEYALRRAEQITKVGGHDPLAVSVLQTHVELVLSDLRAIAIREGGAA